MPIPEAVRAQFVSGSSPEIVEIYDRGGQELDTEQTVHDVVGRYALAEAMATEHPDLREKRPEYYLNVGQRRIVADWVAEVAPTGIPKYRAFLLNERSKNKDRANIKTYFPEAYALLFPEDIKK